MSFSRNGNACFIFSITELDCCVKHIAQCETILETGINEALDMHMLSEWLKGQFRYLVQPSISTPASCLNSFPARMSCGSLNTIFHQAVKTYSS